jgi:hypothetical protein
MTNARAPQTTRRWTCPSLIIKKASSGRLKAQSNGAPYARRCAATREGRAPCDASWRPLRKEGSAPRRREARLCAKVRAYDLCAVQGRCLVRAQLLEEHVAPGGNVGVEVLEGERVGPQARADAQVDVRHHRAGRAVLSRDVLDQARAPAHGVHAPLPYGEAKGVDAHSLLGPVGVGGHHASSSGSGHNRHGGVGSGGYL